MKLRAIIVDDEELARKNLAFMLDEYCPEIEVIGEASGKDKAKAIIEISKPDIVFLDIRMPSGSEGFELLDELDYKRFQLVFVTAFKEYAIQAFNANAAYYLLKPIDSEELKGAVKKLLESHQKFTTYPDGYEHYFEAMENLAKSLLKNKPNHRIAISHTKGIKLVEDDDISYLEAQGNCTMLYFENGSRYLDTRTLKVYEDLLDPTKFFRVHKSHIVNIQKLTEYSTEDGNFAVLKGGAQISIARNRVSDFVQMLKNLK
jgi:two-component system LytT family response regulator